MGGTQSTEVVVLESIKNSGFTASQSPAGLTWDVTGGALPSIWDTKLEVNNQNVAILSKCAAKVKPDSLANVNAYLCGLNYSLAVSIFLLDFKNGEVVLKTSAYVETTVPNRALGEQLIGHHIKVLNELGEQVVRAVVTPSKSEMFHFGIKCLGCDVDPISGKCYSCAECHFNLCSSCYQQNKEQHQHPLVQYSTPFSGPKQLSTTETDPVDIREDIGKQEDDMNGDILVDTFTYASSFSETSKLTEVYEASRRVSLSNVAPSEPIVTILAENQLEFKTENGKRAKLAKNGYAHVYLAQLNSTEVVVKFMKSELAQDMRALFRQELSRLATLHHPHIVPILGLCDCPPFFVTPLLPKGNLQNVILSQSPELKIGPKIKFLKHIARGMAYLHSNKIIHAALKPENILLDENDSACVSDFGLAKVRAIVDVNSAENISIYSSPEQMSGHLTQQGDVYSFGVIAWALITYKTPFLNQYSTRKELKQKIKKLGLRPDEHFYPLSTPLLLKSLITECWHSDPAQRPAFVDILDRLELITKMV